GTVSTPSGSPEQIAQQMLSQFGWSASQFSCLQPLWAHESGWSVTAENPSSGAYGIPQALPGSKMSSAGPGWESDAATQIRWGLTYIQSTYGSPCGAWGHEETAGWY
ncbi:MAG TPA: lytic transglycosylase domain-containing protein, partial [Trebonia sp.]|nr:lytic transglycosylase domain-containing protein [Trebonia sp.]